ncbi:hypothetical protein F5X96DRAFT_661965 [Biscogniauxia mediterranea]|nr:hypothetical protein F5X96DRAFT_661965 [Biscogniauxia mediterranea]
MPMLVHNLITLNASIILRAIEYGAQLRTRTRRGLSCNYCIGIVVTVVTGPISPIEDLDDLWYIHDEWVLSSTGTLFFLLLFFFCNMLKIIM